MKEKLFSITKKDLEVQTFCSGGPGGQHQNKTQTGVRIIHKESGAFGESRSEKSQLQNKKIALKHLTESKKFKIWINKKSWEVKNKKTIEQIVEEKLTPNNLKIEIKDENGKWREGEING
jgi:protein subunit release factor B